MLTIKQIRDDMQAAARRLAKKGVDAAPVIEKIVALDDRRKAIQVELDTTLAAQNKAAKEIGALMGQGRRDEAEERKRFVADLKEKSSRLQAESTDVQQELQAALVTLPNFPADIVPEGRTAEDNLVVKLVENYTALPENPLPHWELAKKYDIIDFDLGVKLTGAGFPVYKGKGARLQRALINYFLDCNTRAGYLEVEPPIMVNEASGFGTGQLPDKEGQMYHATVDNFYMIPTAEVPVTNIYRDVILDEKDFPVKMTAYTPCFRREAGSYGKDVRGLNRLHQFDKVEIVQLSLPERSYEALDGMVAHVEGIVRSLGLPYRILRLCGGDMSFTSARYPSECLTAEENVTNRLAEAFYRDHGVLRIERGLDLAPTTAGRTVLRSAYCIRREIGECLRENPRLRGGLWLERGRHRYRLDFDCRRCEMSLVDCTSDTDGTNLKPNKTEKS